MKRIIEELLEITLEIEPQELMLLANIIQQLHQLSFQKAERLRESLTADSGRTKKLGLQELLRLLPAEQREMLSE